MATCIYCLRVDPSCRFSREHVLPLAFGRFRSALVLPSEVCADCNQYFGNTIDRLLGRDSAEAVLRVRNGVGDSTKVARMFRDRVTVRLPPDGTQWGGILLKFDPTTEASAVPGVNVVVPQVGFESSRAGQWEYFTDRDLPATDVLDKRFETGEYTGSILVLSDSTESYDRIATMLDRLPGKRHVTGETVGLPIFQSQSLRVEVNTRFDAVLARALAKIGLNYAAKTRGGAFALRPEFDPIRSFVRSGTGHHSDFVTMRGPTDGTIRETGGPRGHQLGLDLSSDGTRILALVSPFTSQYSYVITLTSAYKAAVWTEVRASHFYSLADRSVHQRVFSRFLITPSWRPR